ncbi:hypothetical protein [Sphingomonas arenae]|uniref:hypothetical protein n=1 Tax=Sphingomonas arenae TaxID=2812555 RepID=UPI00196803B3|nr:hypothetical protein [Sphingomonas arenae]
MATLALSPLERVTRERRFYTRMALFLAAVVFIGFAPSFYLRGYVSFPRPNPTLPPAVMLHGLVFTAWMLLVVAQTQLIAANRRDLHMKLGLAGMAFAAALIPIMYLTAVWQVARANQPPFTDPLSWSIVPIAGIVPFALLLWLGWSRRRDAQWHKRAMLSAAILTVAGPAIGRLPLAPPSLAGFTVQMILGLLLFVPLFLWDRRSLGRIHPATWTGFSLAAVTQILPSVLMALDVWAPIAARLPGI